MTPTITTKNRRPLLKEEPHRLSGRWAFCLDHCQAPLEGAELAGLDPGKDCEGHRIYRNQTEAFGYPSDTLGLAPK